MKKISLKVLTAEIVFLFLVFALCLFLAAGTIAWAAGWIFMALFFSFVVAITLWLFKYNPGLLQERMRVSKADQKAWDKVFFAVLQVVFIAWLLLMPLDAVRFHWSEIPVWLQIVGAILLIGSFILFFLTFRENSFLSPMVRMQRERGQTVVSSGPYHYVRHPMYAAMLLFIPGTTLLMGSWYGLILGVILVVMIARRALGEEQMLREELEGYDTYMTQVRYRFIPAVW